MGGGVLELNREFSFPVGVGCEGLLSLRQMAWAGNREKRNVKDSLKLVHVDGGVSHWARFVVGYRNGHLPRLAQIRFECDKPGQDKQQKNREGKGNETALAPFWFG